MQVRVSLVLTVAVKSALTAVVLAVFTASSPQTWDAYHNQMRAALSVLQDHFKAIDERSHLAAALEDRLNEDAALEPIARPQWSTPDQFLDYAVTIARLDSSLIDQLATGKPHAVDAIHSLDDVPIPSVVDRSMQPWALYIPPSYRSVTPAPLVVFLHGATQSEATVIASPWIRKEADATGAIIIAPYARGDSQYADPAPLEVYQSVGIAEHAFNIDKKRVYLAGHSMGGFGVFVVAPLHPEMWAALLCASGSLTEDNKTLAARHLAGKRVYVVDGALDTTVPPAYPKRTVSWLRAAGAIVGYYEQPDGGHPIGTIYPAFSKAWRDMLNGVMPSAHP